MNYFIHRMIGHYLQDETEEGADLSGVSDNVEQEEDGSDDEPEPEEEDEGEVIVTLGDTPVSEPEEDEAAASPAIREMRKRIREQNREIRELKSKTAASAALAPKAPEVGPEPSLEDEDVDFDGDKFKVKYAAWLQRKHQADQSVAEQQRQQEEQQQAWQAKLDGYQSQKAKLRLPDYEDAEQAIQEAMDVTQQGIIISGADNPALIVYALGKNPAKAKELAAIKDPVKFAFAIAKLETQVKMQKKGTKPAPEKTITGTAPKSGAVDSTLERLRADAEKTGDYSKVHQYKRQKKSA